MPMERMSTRHVRECLRLKSAGISTREIARRVGVASSTVRLTLRRCEAAGIACPLGAGLTDAVQEQLLFANAGVKPGHRRHAEPDWAVLHREMRRTSPCRSFGRNISPPILAVIGTKPAARPHPVEIAVYVQLQQIRAERTRKMIGFAPRRTEMQFGMIGHGRMGANMAMLLMKTGHECWQNCLRRTRRTLQVNSPHRPMSATFFKS